MLAVATAYDALRSHLVRKAPTPTPTSARWRPYHSRKVTGGLSLDDTHPSEREASLPTPEDASAPRSRQTSAERTLPSRRSTRQQPAATPVQDPEGLIENSLSLLASIYNPSMVARALHAATSPYDTIPTPTTALPTPPASPTPQVHAQTIAPHVMHWFIVELLRRSHTSAPVIRAALAYIAAAAPAIRRAIEDEADPESPLLDPRRVYLAAVILGSKFLLDRTYTNKTWACVSGLDALEVGRCERTMGEVLEWRLWVGGPSSPSVF